MNEILLATILAGVGAQAAKVIINIIRQRRVSLYDAIVTGGMPSSHSAFVVGLSTSIFLVEGVTSTFVVSLVLAVVVLRDAFGVRRSVGEEGMLLLQVVKKLKLKAKAKFDKGHTPLQVTVGSAIGLAAALLVHYL